MLKRRFESVLSLITLLSALGAGVAMAAVPVGNFVTFFPGATDVEVLREIERSLAEKRKDWRLSTIVRQQVDANLEQHGSLPPAGGKLWSLTVEGEWAEGLYLAFGLVDGFQIQPRSSRIGFPFEDRISYAHEFFRADPGQRFAFLVRVNLVPAARADWDRRVKQLGLTVYSEVGTIHAMAGTRAQIVEFAGWHEVMSIEVSRPMSADSCDRDLAHDGENPAGP